MDLKRNGARRVGRDLARAFTVQSRFSNRIWLTLVVATTLTLFKETSTDNRIKLPFSLGSADAQIYNLFAFLLLTILLIAFCQAFSLTHAAVRFAHEYIDDIKPKESQDDARTLFDISVVSAFSRVAQLATISSWPRVSAIYYCLLKLIAVGIILLAPSAVLIKTFVAVWETTSWSVRILCAVAGLIAMTGVLKILVHEIRHTRDVAVRFWKGELGRFGLVAMTEKPKT